MFISSSRNFPNYTKVLVTRNSYNREKPVPTSTTQTSTVNIFNCTKVSINTEGHMRDRVVPKPFTFKQMKLFGNNFHTQLSNGKGNLDMVESYTTFRDV